MVAFKVIIEGGGGTHNEQAALRKGFTSLFDKLKLPRRPAVICAGSRSQAFKDFQIEVKRDPETVCLLLVDSEELVSQGSSPWDHVARREGDHWQRPANVTDGHLHFMVVAMEAWLTADPDTLAAYYGSKFKKDKLPQRQNLEEVPKADLVKALEAATKDAKTKGKYEKSHGFDLVGMIDPAKVRERCRPFAERFFRALKEPERVQPQEHREGSDRGAGRG